MRRWFKLWVEEELNGAVRFALTPAERSVWVDLRALASRSQQDGLITAPSGKPYPHNWIATTLNVSRNLLESTLGKLENLHQIDENEDGIRLMEWGKYQSEYERQRPYRKGERPVEGPDRYIGQKHNHMVQR